MKAIVCAALIALMSMPAFAGDPPMTATMSRKEALQAVARFLRGNRERIVAVACDVKECSVYRENLK